MVDCRTSEWTDREDLSDEEVAPTFPLALKPVSHIVTPVCLSKTVRSEALTEPARGIVSIVERGVETDVHTLVKSDVSGHGL